MSVAGPPQEPRAGQAGAGGWDCHAHVFGPYAQFPLAAERSYTPPEAVEAGYLAMLERLGLDRGVLVHPSAYGDDHALLLHTLARQPQLRGVVVLRPGSPLVLQGLRARGVRAVRVMHRSNAGGNFAGSASFADLQALVPQMAEEGLHAEMWTDTQALPELASAIRQLPFPLVIDHMGSFDLQAGVDQPGFRVLRELLAEGKVWVKLCAYRNLTGEADWELGRPFQEALVAANPDQLVWGSDWPFLRVQPVPDPVKLLELLVRWSQGVAEKVLRVNPGRLYA